MVIAEPIAPPARAAWVGAWLAPLLLHAGLAAALLAAWLGSELHPASHPRLGMALAAAFGLWAAFSVVRCVVDVARRRRVAATSVGLRWLRGVLRAALILAVALVAGSGLLLSDATWGARSVVVEGHEALAKSLPWLLALHAASEITLRWPRD